ncbi:FecR family protein [Flavobacterium cerinum]|uniref:FecR family protein n=1 Tax=Flavobacterium cerinum TaxID=2502784 RepID=A0A444GL67_9FLAO|nr:FecR domain-containing protein [Flavobacterium cerinum]RWW91717.1 FecR family protein [Flavobacterium cerinum]
MAKKQSPARLLFLFQQYINNECNEETLAELLEGLKDTSADQYLDTVSLSLWEAIKKHNSKTLTEVMKMELQAEARQLISESDNRKPVYKLSKRPSYRKIAAAIILFISLGAAFYIFDGTNRTDSKEQVELAMEYFQSGARQRKHMSLPDGSVIYLNSDTKLGIRTASFNREKREVWLEEGEAFFEVAKNPEKPFIVHTQDLETTVKGTSFNVKAYKELDESSVSVRNGKVQVHNENKLLGTLTQNRQIVYNKITGRFDEQQASWKDPAAWMESRLVMKQANVKELKLRLKQHFGVDVEIKENALQGKLLSCSFHNRVSLKEVLDGITLLYGLKYDISNPGKAIIYK